MSYNLFIVYDLMSPGQNYNELRDAIQGLGPHWQFQFSLYYVHTSMNANEAYSHLSTFIDGNDRLMVIDANGGVTTNWDNPPLNEINAIWSST